MGQRHGRREGLSRRAVAGWDRKAGRGRANPMGGQRPSPSVASCDQGVGETCCWGRLICHLGASKEAVSILQPFQERGPLHPAKPWVVKLTLQRENQTVPPRGTPQGISLVLRWGIGDGSQRWATSSPVEKPQWDMLILLPLRSLAHGLSSSCLFWSPLVFLFAPASPLEEPTEVLRAGYRTSLN